MLLVCAGVRTAKLSIYWENRNGIVDKNKQTILIRVQLVVI